MRSQIVAAVLCAGSVPPAMNAATLQAGPDQMYAKPCAAIAAAASGDIIEIDASGSYAGDVCGWPGTVRATARVWLRKS